MILKFMRKWLGEKELGEKPKQELSFAEQREKSKRAHDYNRGFLEGCYSIDDLRGFAGMYVKEALETKMEQIDACEEAEKLRDLLESLQWCLDIDGVAACPVCRAWCDGDHHAKCDLNEALLRGSPKT